MTNFIDWLKQNESRTGCIASFVEKFANDSKFASAFPEFEKMRSYVVNHKDATPKDVAGFTLAYAEYNLQGATILLQSFFESGQTPDADIIGGRLSVDRTYQNDLDNALRRIYKKTKAE